MGGTCHRCGTAVDPLRSPARIVGTRVVPFCRICATTSAPATRAAMITGVTAVESTDADSGEASGEFIVAARPEITPTTRSRTRTALTAATIAALALLGYRLIEPSRGATTTPAPLLTASLNTMRSAPAPVPDPSVPDPPVPDPPVPDPSVSVPVSADPSSLAPRGAFIHPLPGRERLLPTNSSRRFGAERPGHRPSECRAGHCGVDLAGPVGTPVLSVRDGTVQRVVRSADGSGGRFVAVDHGDMITYYFHLDEIRADLVVGLHVAAGEPIGTLGHTGILRAPAHLHFALRLADLAGDGGRPRYVDPVPYLERATVLSSPGPVPADSTRTPDAAPAPSVP